MDLIRSIAGTTENIGGIAFGIGSCLFFYLFFKSRYIPRVISALGLVASVIWTALYFANLVFPEHRALFPYICFPPMALAEVVTGFYLMLFAVGTKPRTVTDSASTTVHF
jgi:branched-subunit amino acid transport protein